MARILYEQKSSIGSPYVFYTVYAAEVANSRTANSVKIKVDVDSHLQYNASYLGNGYPLNAYIKLLTNEYSLPIKESNETWSGTTTHRYSRTITLNNIEASLNSITDVKFRVSPQDSGYLPITSCSNIPISIGHNVPSDVSYTMTETNPLLISAGISNDLIIENLSIKQFSVSYTLHDDATIKNVGIYNITNSVLSENNPFSVDLKNISFVKDMTYPTKIPIIAFATDSLDTRGFSNDNTPDLYDFITYTPLAINNSTTIAKRVGQTSGYVSIDVNGGFFNGIIGNIDQTSYKPIIKYKYWKYGDTEPSTYENIIPSSSITIAGNLFSISSLNIGSTTETDPNYFDPQYSYRIKIYVEDNFTSIESNELQIQVGEAICSEYKDRVDFKKITLKNEIDVYDTLTNLPIIAYGQTALVTVGSNTYKDINISYSDAGFTSIPRIFTNLDGNASNGPNGGLSIAVVRSTVSTTSATLRLSNNTSTSPSFYINWLAIGK